MHDNKNAQVKDYSIKEERLCVPLSIVHNATPANKTNASDLSAAMTLALEGQTAAAAAIDAGTNFATPTDSTGVFGILMSNLGTVNKLLKSEVVNLSSGTAVVTPAGASASGVTASGNIAVSVDWSGSLATTDLSTTLCIDYNILKA